MSVKSEDLGGEEGVLPGTSTVSLCNYSKVLVRSPGASKIRGGTGEIRQKGFSKYGVDECPGGRAGTSGRGRQS